MTMDYVTVPLYRVAHARAGDKGNRSNISVISWAPELYPVLLQQVTEAVVAHAFQHRQPTAVQRYEVASLHALNFVIDDVLDGGVNSSHNLDAHGKTLSYLLLDLPVRVPKALEKWLAGEAEETGEPRYTSVVDCHAHIIGPADQYPLDGGRAYTPAPASVGEFRAVMERCGVDRAVIIQPSFYGDDNRCTLDAVRELGPGACAVVVVRPDIDEDSMREMVEQGAVGLRLNYLYSGKATAQNIMPYVELAQRHGLHLQFFQTPDVWQDLLPALVSTEVQWVVDHLGMVPAGDDSAFATILKALECDRGWIKLSGLYRVSKQLGHADARQMVQQAYSVAPTRCVWGSDWPHTDTFGLPDSRALLDVTLGWLPDDTARRRVLVDNPAFLYKYQEK